MAGGQLVRVEAGRKPALAGGALGVVELCGWLPQSERWQEGATGMKGLPKQLANTLFTYRSYDICMQEAGYYGMTI